jgi:hypothetical protein
MKTLLNRIKEMSDAEHRKLLYIGIGVSLLCGNVVLAGLLLIVSTTLQD